MSKLFKIVMPEKLVKNSEDILLGSEYMDSSSFLGDIKYYNIDDFGINSFEVLHRWGYDVFPFAKNVMYQCPFGDKIAKRVFYAVYPFGISDIPNEEKIDKPYVKLINTDGYGVMFSMSHIQKSIMGHGYTSGNLPADGSPENNSICSIKMSDGNIVYCYFSKWFNK